MTFLNPILLLGTLAVAVPIVLHLLNRRRVDRVRWAAMRFLRASIERNQRQLRLEDLLLLAIRCLLLALLAFALARPALRGGGGGGGVGAVRGVGSGAITALVLMDVSGSMQASDGVQSRLASARQAGAELLSTFPPGSRVALWAVSDGSPETIIPEPTPDLTRVRQAIDAQPPIDRATDLTPAIAEALAWATRQPAPQPREIFLITDAQRNGLDLARLPAALDKARTDARLTLITLGETVPNNLALSGLSAATGIPTAGHPFRLTATVTNRSPAGTSSASAARSVRVLLRSGGGNSPPVDEAVIPELAPGESRSVSLFARLATPGAHGFRAEIEGDAAPFDDARSLVVRARSELRVLILEGPRASATAPETAPGFFLRQAIAPLTPGAEQGAAAGQRGIRVETVSPAAAMPDQVAAADILVLADVPGLPSTLAEAIVRRVRAGGGLIVFPGPETRPDTFSGDLAALLPAQLGQPQGDPAADKPRVTFSPARPDHPISILWADKAAGDLTSAAFYRTVPLSPRADARQILAYSDGTPAILERTEQLGRVLLFSSTANTAWNNLPLRPGIYVPLLHRTLAHLLAADDAAYNLRPGPPILASPPANWVGREVEIFPPGADLARPAETLTTVELAPDGQPRFTLPKTDRAGIYLARPVNPPAGAAPSLLYAVTPAPEESDLTPHAAGDLNVLADHATVTPYTGPGSLTRIASARAGTELFFPLAVIVLLLAASETLFAFFFSRPK